MRVTTDSCYSRQTKVEQIWSRVPSLLEERHNEASKTAIYVQTNLVFLRQFGKTWDIIHAPVWEVDSGAHNLGVRQHIPPQHIVLYSRTIIVFLFLRKTESQYCSISGEGLDLHGSFHLLDIHLTSYRIDRDCVYFDFQVVTSFVERCMS